jgi:hypothetical protein
MSLKVFNFWLPIDKQQCRMLVAVAACFFIVAARDAVFEYYASILLRGIYIIRDI